jgi:hypothetical protein
LKLAKAQRALMVQGALDKTNAGNANRGGGEKTVGPIFLA